MTSEWDRHERLQAVFLRACELTGKERTDYLQQACGGDETFLREVEGLLALDPGTVVPASLSFAQAPGGAGDSTRELLDRVSQHTPPRSRYRLEGEIARGGMGSILRVWDEDLRRYLAMKVVLGKGEPAVSGRTPPVDPRTLGRFLEEAQVTGQLDHPGIVPVHELGLDGEGRVYFTMKLVKGKTLGAVFEELGRGEGGWTQTRVVGLILRICEAMSYAHAKGVIHRDLKPANVMVGAYGEVYVMDWGLARIVGQEDRKDLRIQVPTAVIVSDRRQGVPSGGSGEPGGPLLTMDGDIVGTPAYMPPEQAAGDVASMGPQSDVYAVGAILYHLLAGHMPYLSRSEYLDNFATLRRVRAGPPRSLREAANGAPAELVAICEKAMERDPDRRYTSMPALAADLSAYVEGRVVSAYEVGAWAEARKWILRNRALAASLAAAVLAILVGGISFAIKADEASRAAGVANARAEDVLRLSSLQRLEDLTAEADQLWPAHPPNLPLYEGWLARAEDLVAELPNHERKLAELRTRALPWPPEEQAEFRASHPRRKELARLERELAYREAREAVLESGEAGPEPGAAEVGVDFSDLPEDARMLNRIAWPLVDPEREDFGDERKGLVLARAAVEKSTGASAAIHDTLAWALFAVGRLDEALAEEERALEAAPTADRTDYEGFRDRMRAAIETDSGPGWRARAQERRSAIRARMAAIEVELSTRVEWAFDSDQDRWWHNQLQKLVDGLHALADPATGLLSDGMSVEHGWSVKRRVANAASLREGFAEGGEPARAWATALPGIRATYPGLPLVAQVGLVPIGVDPDSKLWEFAHLETGEPAVRGADGKLVLTGETGLVLVLLPGGTFQMGAQSRDPDGPNYDPQAAEGEGPVHTVTLSAFFLSKYEMTQAQWQRFTGTTPSHYAPGNREESMVHPVEQVSWLECAEAMMRLGLSLPSEAQWEYGARAGTTTPWWTGGERESLRGAANLADQAAARAGFRWAQIQDWPDLDDGYWVHGPVDSLRANAFGLHNVHGNVWEWCQDGFGYDGSDYRLSTTAEPLVPPEGSSRRMYRGGCFLYTAEGVRSARRGDAAPSFASATLGLRPARAIAP